MILEAILQGEGVMCYLLSNGGGMSLLYWLRLQLRLWLLKRRYK